MLLVSDNKSKCGVQRIAVFMMIFLWACLMEKTWEYSALLLVLSDMHMSKMQYEGPKEILRELLFCSLFSFS